MPSRTAPHRPLASTPHVPCTIHPSVHFSTPPPLLPLLAPAAHSVFLHSSILLLFHHHPHAPAPTCPGSLCHLHGLVDPYLPSLSPARSPLSRGPSPASPIQAPVVPRIPTPPPHQGPPPCLLSQQLLPFHLCTFLFPCGPFSGRNGTFLHGSSRESRRERARAQPGDRRERGGQGVVGARGLGEQGDVKCVGRRGLGQGGVEIGGWGG